MFLFTIQKLGDIYRVSQKKGSHRFKANLEALNGLKSKSGRKYTPLKIQFEACLQPVYTMYTVLVSGVY